MLLKESCNQSTKNDGEHADTWENSHGTAGGGRSGSRLSSRGAIQLLSETLECSVIAARRLVAVDREDHTSSAMITLTTLIGKEEV